MNPSTVDQSSLVPHGIQYKKHRSLSKYLSKSRPTLNRFLSDDQSDDVEISKQIRTLYTRSNKLLRMFSYCTSCIHMTIVYSIVYSCLF